MADAAMPSAPTAPAETGNRKLQRVRVEDDTSIGRSYSKKAKCEVGIGERRKTWMDKSFNPTVHTCDSLTYKFANLNHVTRAGTLKYFHNTWDLTETLFDAIKADAYFYDPPDVLRRPMIFYFGHVAASSIIKLNLGGLCDNVNVLWQKMFETGVDEMSWDDMDDMQDPDYPWPTVKETQAFRMQCKKTIEDTIAKMPEKPVTMDSDLWAVWMGTEHERIHLETSSVLFRQMPQAWLEKPKGWTYCPKFAATPEAAPANALVSVSAGKVSLGKPDDFPSFGWDNEYGRRDIDVPAFQASKFLVTNAEFLPFVLDGGYENRKWWVSAGGDDEGWRWLSYRGVKHPLWWVATSHKKMERFCGHRAGAHVGHQSELDDGTEAAGDGEHFRYRAMFDIIDMPWDWPAEVNYHEARAFLNWKGARDGKAYRMPTEAEHHRMRGVPNAWDEPRTPGWEARVDHAMADEMPGNINMKFGSPSPVDMFDASPMGFYDMVGNVWEYVEDHFGPLPGYKIHYLYDDFSTPCFDGWHTAMLGGSWIATGDEASVFARFQFRRHFQQHLGFRYVTNETVATEDYPGCATVQNLWEGAGSLSEDMDSGYAKKTDLVAFPKALSLPAGGDYPQKVLEILEKAMDSGAAGAGSGAGAAAGAGTASATASGKDLGSVLHLGCGVGATSFEIARSFSVVSGVDNVEPLIRYARVMQHHGEKYYERVTEGILTKTELVRVPDGVKRSRVQFWLCDACELSDEARADAPYNVIFVDGLLERLKQPLDLFKALPDLLAPGGVLVVASANDWRKSSTPRNSWLGGFQLNGDDMDTLAMLTHLLKKTYTFEGATDVAKLKRRHERKYDVSVMQVSVWRKK